MTLSLSASSIDEARSILHKQWYSIIDIKEIVDTSILNEGNFFYFDIISNWNRQSWKIQSDDIFKAYRKLVEDLKYQVLYIYTSPNADEDQKKMMTAKVQDGYRMYLDSIGKKEEDFKQKTPEKSELEGISEVLLKEIERYTKIIDDTISKIQNLLIKNHEIITPEQKSLLERTEITLVQLKGTRNIWNIQTTLEASLKDIGAIEIEILKQGHIQEKTKFLAETNNLLKNIGSSDKIQTEEEKQATVEYKLQSFFSGIFSSKKADTPKKEVQTLDTNSFTFFKNKRELDIYKKSLSANDVAIIKAITSFQFSKIKKLFLKRKLLNQNIQIIENRINNKSISYTKVIRWFDYYLDLFFASIEGIVTIFVWAIFLYSVAYIWLQTASVFWLITVNLNYNTSVLYLVMLMLVIAIFSFIRGWKTLIIFIPICIFLLWFLSRNF